MSTHELARLLLTGEDLPVSVQVNMPDDAFWSKPGGAIRVQRGDLVYGADVVVLQACYAGPDDAEEEQG